MNIPVTQYLNLLSKYLNSQKAKVGLLALLLVAGTGIYLLNPQIMRYFIDVATGEVVTDNPTRSLFFAGLLFLTGALVTQGLWVAQSYVGQDIGWASTNKLRRDLAQHCLNLDMDFHNRHTPGEFIERIDGDVSTLANFFSQFTIEVVGKILMLIGILALLFREDWRIGLAMSVIALVLLAVLGRLINFATPYWEKARAASANFFGFLEERLAGTEDLRASGATAYTMRRFYELARRHFRIELRAEIMEQASWSIISILMAVGQATALLIGGYLFQTGSLTIGSVYLVFHYTNMLRGPIQRLSEEVNDLQRASAGVKRIQEFLDVRPQIIDGQQHPPQGPLALTFEQVSFAYPTTTKSAEPIVVLDDISFQLRPKSILGLLGRTGSGKTTITRLITRLYEADSGYIRLGDSDISNTRLSDLRQCVGVVTQNVQLFNASVRDNLTFFDETVPDAQILDTLQALRLEPWFQSLSDGLDTRLASGGSSLSTGQAQLLAFARVFLRDPGFIILDEASSRLDPATERLIEQAIDKLLVGRTAIIIAHRLATVQRADDILILDGGRIAEYGARADLEADPTSRFYELLQTGLSDYGQQMNKTTR